MDQLKESGALLAEVGKELERNHGCTFKEGLNKVCQRRRQVEEKLLLKYEAFICLPLVPVKQQQEKGVEVREDNEQEQPEEDDDNDNNGSEQHCICTHCGFRNVI